MTMLAEGADECVAYEAVYFGIALFEGGNPMAQTALMKWFQSADECFFDSMVEKIRKAIKMFKDRQVCVCVCVCCAVLCCAVLCCAALCCAALCCAALRFAVLRCAVLCCAEGAVTKRQKAGMSTHG